MKLILFQASHSTTKECGPNEEISPCSGPCTNRTCKNLNPPIVCPTICATGVCDCKMGFRRLDSGECVPENECPNFCDRPNEVRYDCYKECEPRTCPNVTENKNATCTCQSGKCDCINGFLRNICGICVEVSQCSTGCSCSSTESVQCVNSCTKKTCEDVVSGVQKKCTTQYCSKTCECLEDFARLNGECVPNAQCCY